jgi:hypothetical protein
MNAILPDDDRNRQAHSAAEIVANKFVTEVEEARGSTADAACTPKKQTDGSETGNGLCR